MIRPILWRRPQLLRHAIRRPITTTPRVKPPTNAASNPSAASNPKSKAPSPNSTTTSSTSKSANSSPSSISLKSLNAFAVSQASAGGSRGHIPPKFKVDRLSPEYRSKARKITIAMISAPIAIVTSWVLYMRIWGGRERLGKSEREPREVTVS